MTMSWQPSRDETGEVAALFGGAANLHAAIASPIEAHALILAGIPTAALQHLLGNLEVLDRNRSLERVVGISLRTFQRRRDDPSRPLSPETSGRAWKFAEVLARAIGVFGSQSDAEHWLDSPARGLDGHKPIDLLATPAGTEMVETLLGRIDRGVYV